jgi:replicative DNA helicase
MSDFTHDTPPQAPDMERAVLSACLFENEAIDIAAELIGPEAFYKPANGLIYQTILDLHAGGDPVDQLSVCEELRKQGKLEQVGGEATIASLAGEITGAANVAYHCKILKDKLSLRRSIAVATSLRGMCFETNADPEDIASQMQLQAQRILDAQETRPQRRMSEVMTDAYSWLVEKANKPGPMGIPTGLPALDKIVDGWLPGNLIVIAGPTGEGKTALALDNFALHAGKHGIPTAIFSLEMADVQIGVRLVSGESRFDTSKISYHKPNSEEWAAISDACARLASLPLFIDESPDVNIGQMGAKLRRFQRDNGVQLAVVDYLQLMDGDKSAQSREQEVAGIARDLKLLAESLKIPIIALSQLNDDGKVRESRAIEQNADKIIIIRNPEVEFKQKYAGPGEYDSIRELWVKKHRGGPTGSVPVVWKPEYVTFYELDY